MIADSKIQRTYADPWTAKYDAIRAARRHDDHLRAVDPLVMVVLWRDGLTARTNVPMWDEGPEWGYLGGGPSALARAVMALYGRPDLAYEFKVEIIARVPQDGAMLSATAIRAWIGAHGEAEAA